jgi:hypothetical protein
LYRVIFLDFELNRNPKLKIFFKNKNIFSLGVNLLGVTVGATLAVPVGVTFTVTLISLSILGRGNL